MTTLSSFLLRAGCVIAAQFMAVGAMTRPNVLFNLRDDLSEKHDLAKENPGKANALRVQLHAWRDSVGAALPKPKPDFKGGKPKPQKSQPSP